MNRETCWVRSPGDDGHFSAKKNVYAKSVQGTYSDASNNWANVELDAVNVNLIRYSEVLLWAAECEVIVNSNLTQAQTYVNMVRARAAELGLLAAVYTRAYRRC